MSKRERVLAERRMCRIVRSREGYVYYLPGHRYVLRREYRRKDYRWKSRRGHYSALVPGSRTDLTFSVHRIQGMKPLLKNGCKA